MLEIGESGRIVNGFEMWAYIAMPFMEVFKIMGLKKKDSQALGEKI